MTQEAVDAIWQDDLFERQSEAELLIGYVESVWNRPTAREDVGAYTIAIDAEYGEGKSFFLRRLAKHLALNHPVAFVDAWADDLADEPMTAIAATLKAALDPLLDEPSISSRWATFMSVGGQVAKIASLGVLKRGLGLLITAPAVEAASDAIEGLADATQDAIDDAIKDAGKDVVEGTAAIRASAIANSALEKKIAEFEIGRRAIAAMKDSLSSIVATLDKKDLTPPIVVIIDELDRCRPTYAIKLLEEIKHLFDVEGLVFIFGLHGDQLAHSVSGAYGPGFDGKAYLRRFLHRRYSLARLDLEPLIKVLLSHSTINAGQIEYPPSLDASERWGGLPLERLIADYLAAYELRPRDAFEVVDILQTCAVLAEGEPLHAAYLIPLIAGHLKGLDPGALPKIRRAPKWTYVVSRGRERHESPVHTVAEAYQHLSKLSDQDIRSLYNQENLDYVQSSVCEMRFRRGRPSSSRLFHIENYPALLTTVARFRSPAISS
jgi:KAP-like P-loop domain-containing protein